MHTLRPLYQTLIFCVCLMGLQPESDHFYTLLNHLKRAEQTLNLSVASSSTVMYAVCLFLILLALLMATAIRRWLLSFHFMWLSSTLQKSLFDIRCTRGRNVFTWYQVLKVKYSRKAFQSSRTNRWLRNHMHCVIWGFSGTSPPGQRMQCHSPWPLEEQDRQHTFLFSFLRPPPTGAWVTSFIPHVPPTCDADNNVSLDPWILMIIWSK